MILAELAQSTPFITSTILMRGVQTVQQRAQGGSPSCQGESPLSQEREIEIQMEQLSSHTSSKIWSPSSADVSVESRQAESKLEGVEEVAAKLKKVQMLM